MAQKLHLGCGVNLLNGWTNVDLTRGGKNVKHFDLCKKFPYKNDTVSFIFNEHLLEHFDEVDGYNFMRECHRVLKKGGCLRISIPNVESLIEHIVKYYDSDNFPKSELPGITIKNARNHCQALNFWFYGNGSTSGVKHKYMSPINKQVNHGPYAHKYYYDFKDISEKLEKIGFTQVYRCEYRKSTFNELSGIEFRPFNNELIIEAVK